MSSTIFVDGTTPVVATWLNDVNKAVYNGIFPNSFTVPATQTTYTPPGAGAVATTVAAKLAQTVSVLDFGADPTGVIDSTTAIQNAINYAASVKAFLFMAAGKFKITSQLNVTNAVHIIGVRGQTAILLATQNMNGIVFGDGTMPTRATASQSSIDGVGFNPAPGVAAFTSGSCVVRNNVYYTNVNNCDFYGYDNSSSSPKLWTSITDISAQQCNAYECTSTYMLGNVLNMSGASGNLCSDNIHDYHQFQNITGDAVAVGNYCAGLTFEKPTAYQCNGWMFNINSGTGNNGQNFFILNPDLEIDGTGNGIWVQQGNGVQIVGGWIGKNTATNPKLIWFGVNSSNCNENNTLLFGGSVVIDGPTCEVGGGVLNGDLVNNTVGITISSTATDTVITPMRLGQFTSAGIQFTSTPPATRCTIDGVKFKSIHGGAAGYEIVGSTGLPGSILGVSGTSAALPPIITSCQSDVSYLFAAAATGSITVSPGRQIMQVTASANITNITNVSDGFRITIQAGSGGITFTNAGNIGLITSPLTVAAFTTVSFINYGNFWFADGKEI